MTTSSDLEANARLHTIIIGDSGLYRDYHKRPSSVVIEGRTATNITNRIEQIKEAYTVEELKEDEEIKYKLSRLRRQLRYRTRIDEFRRLLFSTETASAISKTWKTELSGGLGNNHLHESARFGHVEMCRDLLNEKWNINSRNDLGQTPLVLACREGHVRVVKLLLKGSIGWRGGRAKLLMKDHFGHGCLGYARKGMLREGLKRQRGCSKIVEMLENCWRKRRIIRRNIKIENKLMEGDINSVETSSESDSDPESSVYEAEETYE
jgi:hypothetical protein